MSYYFSPQLLRESFSLGPRGIYWMESAYGDAIDYNYIVDFEASEEEQEKQWDKFIALLKEQGRLETMASLKSEFKQLTKLFE